jgi:hypothetical protein
MEDETRRLCQYMATVPEVYSPVWYLARHRDECRRGPVGLVSANIGERHAHRVGRTSGSCWPARWIRGPVAGWLWAEMQARPASHMHRWFLRYNLRGHPTSCCQHALIPAAGRRTRLDV